MANKWVGTAVLAAALTVAGCNGSGDQVGPSPTHPTSTLTIGGKAERVTDVAAFTITDEEARRIQEACAEAGGVPGDSEECAAILRDLTGDPVDDCSETSDACIVAAVVAETGAPSPRPRIALLIIDPRPGKPACGNGKSSICNGAILSAKVAPPPWVETTNGTEPTTPPAPSTTSPSPQPPTSATVSTEPEPTDTDPTEPDPTEPESPDSP